MITHGAVELEIGESAAPEIVPVKPSWRNRRIFLFLTQITYVLIIAWILWSGVDTTPADTVAWICGAGMFINVLGYVFGAVIDDKNFATAVAAIKR